MTLRHISLNLELGQTILVGQNDEPAQITKIEFHEKSGEVNINTTRGKYTQSFWIDSPRKGKKE